MAVKDPWFEVYKIHPGVFAIYEPHQSEEVICHVLLGTEPAVLFDTGLGISIRAGGCLTRLPVSVLNSHTHNDHVSDNWRFTDIDFTRTCPMRHQAFWYFSLPGSTALSSFLFR